MKKWIASLVGMLSLAGLGYSQTEVVVSGHITANTTWESTNTYLLDGFVRVDSGITLTIQAGTKIYGKNSTQGSLIALPKGKIQAIGTSNNPIVFTSEFTKAGSLNTPAAGDWGGIILLGRAPINVPGGTASIEGPGDKYGGSDPADNSGTLKYVRIEYPGIAFSPGNEINGLTFGGVGSGTVIDYVQVSYSGDDSFEWFGGTVNAKHLIAFKGLDDDFDTDFGFSGKLQFLFGYRDAQIADGSGSNGFESDNDGTGSVNSPRTSPTWWNVTLVGPLATKSTTFNSNFKRGMHLRRSSQNKINNALILGWPTGILVDGKTTTSDANANTWFVKNSIIAGSKSKDLDTVSATAGFDVASWFTTNGGRTFAENTDLLLVDPFNSTNPNPFPAAGSPALTGAAKPTADGFFDATANFVGAFGFIDWTKGWSSLNITVPDKSTGIIAGDITSDLTLTNDKDYTLKGFVRVKSGATLTIQPGTKIYGENSSNGSLIVQPGGKLIADGTKDQPIVFTSEFTKAGSLSTPAAGDWGGVIILGNAPINVPGGTASIEGPGDSYGGNNPTDNSGVIRYVRIEYAGIAFSPNNEINGLTFGGVGSGTKVDYVQVSYSGDDAFEWFGGTVNAKHLIAYKALDDDFDSDFGYSGKLQFLFSVSDPQVADGSGSNGFESDNDGSGSLNSPRTSPTWWNVTLVGPLATKATTFNSNFKRGMHLRRSSQNKISNALILGWPTGILVDGKTTTSDANANTWFVKNSIIAGSKSKDLDTVSATAGFDVTNWFKTVNNGRTFAENSELLLVDPFNSTNPNPFPTSGSPVLTGAAKPTADGFFDATANYVGAFGFIDWTSGWSSLNLTVPEKATGVIAGDITSDLTLTNDKDYTLKGFVRVKSGATLTIQPGTKIYGENSSQGSLIIQPGGKLIADGTKEEPIIFTSEFTKEGATSTPAAGDWGGIILLGKAPINVPGGTASIEGPGDSYGGNDPADNSGVVRYVRIEYAGIAFSPNNEINGLTFGGVGSGTVVDYVQVSYSGDDSFEWFGGSVNAKHLIAYKGLDDDFDTDFGYSGKLQFLWGIRDPQVADASGSNGFESDNDGSGSLNNPRTSPTWWNVTLTGPLANKAATFNSNYKRGMHLRRSSQNKINNALILGWPTGILVDGKTTTSDANANTWFVKNSIIAGSKSKDLDTVSATAGFNVANWYSTVNNGRIFAETTDAGIADAFNLDDPNPIPMNGSPVLTGGGTPPNDGFFDVSATHVGAFGSTDWTGQWSSFSVNVGVHENKNDGLVSSFELYQNYPNPFNPSTKIKFDVAKAGIVNLSVYNMLGQLVTTLVNGERAASQYEITWDATNLATGVYIYRLQAGSTVITKKMLLVK